MDKPLHHQTPERCRLSQLFHHSIFIQHPHPQLWRSHFTDKQLPCDRLLTRFVWRKAVGLRSPHRHLHSSLLPSVLVLGMVQAETGSVLSGLSEHSVMLSSALHVASAHGEADLSAVGLAFVLFSQNHRMVGVGKDFWGSSSPSPLPKQGHLEQAAQDLIQAGFQYLQRRRLHNLPGQPAPVLRHPQSEEILPHVQRELPMLQFVPVAPCPVAGHCRRESGPIILTPSLKIFMGIYKILSQPSLLQAKQAQLPQPFLVGEMLQSPHHLHSCGIISKIKVLHLKMKVYMKM